MKLNIYTKFYPHKDRTSLPTTFKPTKTSTRFLLYALLRYFSKFGPRLGGERGGTHFIDREQTPGRPRTASLAIYGF